MNSFDMLVSLVLMLPSVTTNIKTACTTIRHDDYGIGQLLLDCTLGIWIFTLAYGTSIRGAFLWYSFEGGITVA
ncbi:hypothetical protein V8C40DRAFT_230574 [Trichoderma camerunense]